MKIGWSNFCAIIPCNSELLLELIMRILVAGWHGQIARSIARQAPARTEITALAIGRPALDLCNPPSIRRALVENRPDIVINTAAYTEVDKAETDSDAAFELNHMGAAAFARIADKHKIPMIHLSTDQVFDGEKGEPYLESDKTKPLSVYGRSKRKGEIAVCSIPNHIILRTSWVFSPHNRNFVKTILHHAESQNEVRVVDDQIANPTYAPDLAALILDIAVQIFENKHEIDWGIYHASGGSAVSWFEFARKIIDISERLDGPSTQITPIKSSEYPTQAQRPKDTRLDSSKLASTFGKTLPSWTERIEECIRQIIKPVPQ